MMSGALENMRVLDLTWALAGPFGTMMLCDLGAEVIKIERPGGGDRARQGEPKVDSFSSYFFSLNRGKKSVVIDLTQQTGKNLFLKMVGESDIVVENFTPGTMDKLGLGYKVIKRHNPGIIYAAGSGYGHTGPDSGKPALDIVIQGRGGLMSITGEENGPPVRAGISIGDISGGFFLAIGILSALHEKIESGEGQMIDVSMLDSMAAIEENAFVRYFTTGEVPRRLGSKHPVISPFQSFPTKDGQIVLAATGPVEQWAMFLEKIGRLDLLSDDRLLDRTTRYRYNRELEPIISEALKKKTTKEWIEEFEAIGMPCAPLNSIADAAKDRQLISRGMFVDLPCPGTDKNIKVVGTPVKMSRSNHILRNGAPLLGEHTSEVLSDILEMSPQEIKKLEYEKVIQTA